MKGVSEADNTTRLRADLAGLLEKVRRVESRSGVGGERPDAVPTGWAPVDAALPGGGLARGAVHEWFGVADEDAEPSARPGRSSRVVAGAWRPAMAILIHLARAAARAASADAVNGPATILWIGRRCWPYPPALAAGPDGPRWLGRSVFVDAADVEQRLWAMETSLRCPGVVVVADGRALSMTASRRLQLAAEAGSTIGLLPRPPAEAREPSAARTRWLVARAFSSTRHTRWTARLLRCKGLQPDANAPSRWIVEYHHAQGAVVAPSDVVRGSDSPAVARVAS